MPCERNYVPFVPNKWGAHGTWRVAQVASVALACLLAQIAEKNHRHSAENPRSQFRDIYTLEQVLKSPKVHEPLTKLQCCPTSDGCVRRARAGGAGAGVERGGRVRWCCAVGEGGSRARWCCSV